jgi:hypothetical protein
MNDPAAKNCGVSLADSRLIVRVELGPVPLRSGGTPVEHVCELCAAEMGIGRPSRKDTKE